MRMSPTYVTVTGLSFVAIAVVVASCSTGNGATVCAPGATQACLGPGACRGAQQCDQGGAAWGVCDCGSLDAGAGAGDGQAPPGDDGSVDATARQDAGPPLVVDDQSSSVGAISLPDGGSWFSYLSAGSAGTVTPTPGDPFFFTAVDAGAFSRAACFSAAGVTGTHAGAGFAFQLLGSGGSLVSYDASAYSGISFYAMSPDTAQMTVFFPDIGTDPFWPGATCAAAAEAGPAVPAGGYSTPPCGNIPGAIVPLSAAWQPVKLSFANVSAYPFAGYYDPTSVDSSGLLYMDFQVENPTRGVDGGAPLSFHLCIAQIVLTP